VTAASVDGRLGRRVEGCVRTLLDLGLVHVIASDAHSPDVRAAGLSRAAQAVGDPGFARWLVEEAPRAVISGEPLPVRPIASRRRTFFGRRR
jgi:protein-tyrosine phosphatase